jgi:hypothetical protein
MKNKINAFKKINDEYYVQWTKNGKFLKIEKELAEFIIFCTVNN